MSIRSFGQSFGAPSLRPCRRRPDLTLGVFTDGDGWKVYSQFGSADRYPSRGEALAAAETRAFAAARAGRKVELFVEDEDGALGQARLDAR
jgi:hypothetical protein